MVICIFSHLIEKPRGWEVSTEYYLQVKELLLLDTSILNCSISNLVQSIPRDSPILLASSFVKRLVVKV